MTAFRKVLLKAVKWASVGGDVLRGRRPGPRILIYHQVGAGSGLEMDVATADFLAQMRWIRDHGEPVALDDAIRRSGEPDSHRLYVVTFDDGHESLFEHAFPILKELAIPFTLYVTTGPLENSSPLHGDETMPVCSWEEVASMFESGLMTVGAHSHEHLDARAHPPDVLEHDMTLCNELIELRLGIVPSHFAYTWGIPSDTAAPLVARLYDSAVIGSGDGFDDSTDAHRIPRLPVMATDGSGVLFRRKMWGGFRLETKLRAMRDALNSPGR